MITFRDMQKNKAESALNACIHKRIMIYISIWRIRHNEEIRRIFEYVSERVISRDMQKNKAESALNACIQ